MQTPSVTVEQYRLLVIDFYKILSYHILPKFQGYNAKFSTNSKTSRAVIPRSVKQLFMHCLVSEVCDAITREKKGLSLIPLIYYTEAEIKQGITDHCFAQGLEYIEMFTKLTIQVIEQLKSRLPIRFFHGKHSFVAFKKFKSTSGLYKEQTLAMHFMSSMSFAHFTFEKFDKYANQHGLTFLTKNNFDQLIRQQLLV